MARSTWHPRCFGERCRAWPLILPADDYVSQQREEPFLPSFFYMKEGCDEFNGGHEGAERNFDSGQRTTDCPAERGSRSRIPGGDCVCRLLADTQGRSVH